jgi:hypothetical protein
VRNAHRRLHHAGTLQLDGLCAEMVEQPRACAEQHGHEVDLDLVQDPGSETLLGEVGAANEPDVLAASGRLGLFERGLEAVGDEGVGRPSLLGHRLSRAVGEDEDRHAERGVVSPGYFPGVKHRPSHQQRPGAAGQFAENVSVSVARVAAFAEVGHPGHPLVQPFTAVTHGLSGTGVRAGDEAVERHREAHVDLYHRFLLRFVGSS